MAEQRLLGFALQDWENVAGCLTVAASAYGIHAWRKNTPVAEVKAPPAPKPEPTIDELLGRPPGTSDAGLFSDILWGVCAPIAGVLLGLLLALWLLVSLIRWAWNHPLF